MPAGGTAVSAGWYNKDREDGMRRVVTYEILDEIYEVLEQMAAKSGRPAEALVLEYLPRQVDGRRDNATEQESAGPEGGLERYFGMVDLGYATGTDNEGIDRDLAREYGDTHENEA